MLEQTPAAIGFMATNGDEVRFTDSAINLLGQLVEPRPYLLWKCFDLGKMPFSIVELVQAASAEMIATGEIVNDTGPSTMGLN